MFSALALETTILKYVDGHTASFVFHTLIFPTCLSYARFIFGMSVSKWVICSSAIFVQLYTCPLFYKNERRPPPKCVVTNDKKLWSQINTT